MPVVELERILGLPLVPEVDEDDAEVFSIERMRPDAYAATDDSGKPLWRINPTQVGMVQSYLDYGGGFFPVGTGFGKTLASFLIANEAFKHGIKKILLLIPANAAPQTALQQLPFARKLVELSLNNIHFFYGRPWDSRLSIAKTGGAGLYIVNYSHISAQSGVDLLAMLQPELVIADEAHMLGNPRSGVGKKVMSMLDEMGPQFVAMSGTMAKKKLRQMHHLMMRALHDRSPLPKTMSTLESWSVHLDSHATGDVEEMPESLSPLVNWAKLHYPGETFNPTTSDLRRAFQLRLHSAPGVIATKGESVGTSLYIENRPVEGLEKSKGWDVVKQTLEDVEIWMKTPDGDELEHKMLTFKWRHELNAGGHNSLYWPTPEHMVKFKTADSTGHAAELIMKSQLYHKALQRYHSVLREFLKTSSIGLDTPRDVARSIEKDRTRYVPEEVVEAWDEKEELDFPERVERLRRYVRHSSAKIDAALDWAHEQKGGCIIWYWNTGLGKWATEIGEARDQDVLFCPAGAEANEAIVDPLNASKVVIASIKAHGTAKNLQHFGNQYFIQISRDASDMEQTISRTHRQGQLRDSLVITTNLTTAFDHINYGAMINDAIFAQQTLGQRQRVVFATYNPLPEIFSPEFLKEQGMTPAMLSKEQREMITTRFGGFSDPKLDNSRKAG